MNITEQIARQIRKSAVLDPKNALLLMAIPDYDAFTNLQPYSCRSLADKSKFIGKHDFITRHNPQEVDDFKKKFSRDVGNLNRDRSILAPTLSTFSSNRFIASSLGLNNRLASPLINGSSNDRLLQDDSIWRKTFTTSQKVCWVLTDYGIQTLIGPKYRLKPRTLFFPKISSPRPPRPPLVCCFPATLPKPEASSSLAAFSARDSAQKGIGVDLADEKTFSALSRLKMSPLKPCGHLYSPRKNSPKLESAEVDDESTLSTLSNFEVSSDGTELLSLAPYTDVSWEENVAFENSYTSSPNEKVSQLHRKAFNFSVISTNSGQRFSRVQTGTEQFAMEVSPPSLELGTLQSSQVYLFPVRIRNLGSRQERFRVLQVVATCAEKKASIAEANYQRESARLAPGLAAIITVALSFPHAGRATGFLRVEAEGLGTCDIEIKCIVR